MNYELHEVNSDPLRILYLHGLGGSPGGSKATYLSKRYFTMIPQLTNSDDSAHAAREFESDVALVRRLISFKGPDLIIGSSRGGALALAAGSLIPKILIAPAWRMFNVESRGSDRNIILHSESDQVVAFEDSKALKGRLVACGTDHRMNDVNARKHLEGAIDTVRTAILLKDCQE